MLSLGACSEQPSRPGDSANDEVADADEHAETQAWHTSDAAQEEDDEAGETAGDHGATPSLRTLESCSWQGQLIAPGQKVVSSGDIDADGTPELLLRRLGTGAYSSASITDGSVSELFSRQTGEAFAWVLRINDDEFADVVLSEGVGLEWSAGNASGSVSTFVPLDEPTGTYPGLITRVAEVSGSPHRVVVEGRVATLEGGVVTKYSDLLVSLPHLIGVAAFESGSFSLVAMSAYANLPSHELKIWSISSEGNALLLASLPVTAASTDLFFGDIDSDGRVDLIAGNDYGRPLNEDRPLLISRGDASGGFLPLDELVAVPWFNGYQRRITVVDANNDGFLDVVAWGETVDGWGTVLLTNDKSGYFVEPCVLGTDHKLGFAGDFNGDGFTDLAGNASDGSAWFFSSV